MMLIAVILTASVAASATWERSEVKMCYPCETHATSSSSSPNYRGFGADNLGYDWSPTAWGGPAFPLKRSNDDTEDNRRGKGMKCTECGNSRYTERPFNQETTSDPGGQRAEADMVATVTSPVLGIRLRDDRRVPVEWPGRSMRWDGFRNGMSWDSDQMERRDGNNFRPWDETGQGVSGWDSEGKGYYAADWSYQTTTENNLRWSETPPRTISYQPGGYNKKPDERPPFGNNYPTSSSQHSYSNVGWSQNQPNRGSKPYYEYPTSQPSYYNPKEYEPQRPNYPNYQSNSKPNQSYLPQGPSTSKPPEYITRNPFTSSSGTAIWNGMSKPGYYTGFITELNDPNYSSNKYAPSGTSYPSLAHNRPIYSFANSHNSHKKEAYPAYGSNYIPHNTNKYSTNIYGTSNTHSGGGNHYPNPADNQYQYGSALYPTHHHDRYPNDKEKYPIPPYGHNGDVNRYPGRDPNGWTSPIQYPQYHDKGYSGNNLNNFPPPNRQPSYQSNNRPIRPNSGDFDGGSSPSTDVGNWNYGEQEKDVPYMKSGGSYPSYKGGQYYTSGYLASASTPSLAVQQTDSKQTTETTAGN